MKSRNTMPIDNIQHRTATGCNYNKTSQTSVASKRACISNNNGDSVSLLIEGISNYSQGSVEFHKPTSQFSLKGKAGCIVGGLLSGIAIGSLVGVALCRESNSSCVTSNMRSDFSESLFPNHFFPVRGSSRTYGLEKKHHSDEDLYNKNNPFELRLKKLDEDVIKGTANLMGLDINYRNLSELKEGDIDKFNKVSKILMNARVVVSAALDWTLKIYNHALYNPDHEGKDHFETQMYLLKNKLEYYNTQYGEDEFNKEIQETSERLDSMASEVDVPQFFELPQDIDYITRYLVLLTNIEKSLSLGENGEPDKINILTAKVNEKGLKFERDNKLTPLDATIGSRVIHKLGSDSSSIILADDFFSLCPIDAVNVLVHELVHIYSGVDDYFYTPKNNLCKQNGEQSMSVIAQIEDSEDSLVGLKENISEIVHSSGDFYKEKILKLAANLGVEFRESDSSKEKLDLFVEYYMGNTEFRYKFNSYNADTISRKIVKDASLLFKRKKHMPLIT